MTFAIFMANPIYSCRLCRRRSGWKIHKTRSTAPSVVARLSSVRRLVSRAALWAEQCTAPAIMCRFVSDRFLRSYIFHVELCAFSRVVPLKVSTTAKRFVSRFLYSSSHLPASSELIISIFSSLEISLSLSLSLSLELIRKITAATW